MNSSAPERISLSQKVVDLRQLLVRSSNGSVDLTAIEGKLLRYLAEQEGRVVSRERLLVDVWGYAPTVRSRSVDNTVARLRKKVEDDPSNPAHLITVKGEGYRLDAHVARSQSHDPFVGRRDDLARLDRLQAEPLVTLVGPGGVGKTRLIQEVLAGRPGVFVDFGGVVDEASAAAAIARAAVLPVPNTGSLQTVVSAFAELGGLLVLDNAEDAVDVAVSVINAIDARVVVRVTSRVPLGLPNEVLVPVEPLSHDASGELMRQLSRRWTSDNSERMLLNQLAGFPLAMRLAAPQLDLFGADAVLRSLTDIPEPSRRDQTSVGSALYATLESLPPELGDALGRLSVLDGPFTVGTGQVAIGGGPSHALAMLSRLHQRALIHGDGSRYRLLPLVKTFVRHAVTVDEVAVFRALAAHWVALVGLDADQLQFSGPLGAVLTYRDELPHTQRAIAVLTVAEPDLARRLARRTLPLVGRFDTSQALTELADACAPLFEGLGPECDVVRINALRARGRFDEAMAVRDPQSAAPVERAHLLNALCLVHLDRRELEQGLAVCERVDALCLEVGLPLLQGVCDANRAQLLRVAGKAESALAAAERAATGLWDVPLQRPIVGYILGSCLRDIGRFDEARQVAESALEQARVSGLAVLELSNTVAIAGIDDRLRRFDVAAEGHAKGAQLARRAGQRVSYVACLANQAASLHAIGRLEQARQALLPAFAPPALTGLVMDCSRAIFAAILYELGDGVQADALLAASRDALLNAGDPGHLVRLAQGHACLLRHDPVPSIADLPATASHEALARRL